MPIVDDQNGKKTQRWVQRHIKQQQKAAQRARVVQVGFFDDAKYPNGTPVALVAAAHEFGTKDGRLPERPFMRGGARAAKHHVGRIALADKPDKNDPNPMPSHAALELIGQVVQDEIRRSITNGNWEPNKPATIERKRKLTARGNQGSPKPLIDTGYLLQSVTHAVKEVSA